MKKILAFMLALLIVPLIILSGCGGITVYSTVEAESKVAPDFFFKQKLSVENYKASANNYQKIDFAESNKVSTVYSDAWKNMELINKETLFALTAYDMVQYNRVVSLYDLSVLSPAENKTADNLQNFALYKELTSYYYNLTGDEVSGFIPKSKSINATSASSSNKDAMNLLVDGADNLIEDWGNVLKFSVSKKYTTYTIDVTSAYKYPNVINVPEVDTGDIKIKRDDSQKIIKIFYYSNGNPYTKFVYFTTTVDGLVTKTIKKYDGNQLEKAYTSLSDTDWRGTYAYNYSDITDNVKLLGRYEVKFDDAKSYVYCKHSKYNKTKEERRYVEIYNLKSNVVLARYNLDVNADLTTIDLIIYANSLNAKLLSKTAYASIAEISSQDLTSEYASYVENDALSSKEYFAFNFVNGEIRFTTK